MTARQAARYAEVERMDRAGVPTQEQARRLGLSMARMYGIRSEAKSAGYAVERPEIGRRVHDADRCGRCGLLEPHVCVGGAAGYLQRREAPAFAVTIGRRGG